MASSTTKPRVVLNRVIGPSLCPQKYWYVLTKQLCGVSASAFANNEVFRRFSTEIKSVATDELQSTTNDFINKQPRTFVATTFGLCAGLLRQRDLSDDGFIGSSCFRKIISAINSIDMKKDGGKTFGGNAEDPEVRVRELNTQVNELEAEVDLLKAKFFELETNTSLDSNKSCDSLPSNSPLSLSSGLSTASSSPTNSIELTKNSPIGSTTKKRKIVSLCRNILDDFQDVCEKRNESMACVLGNGFVFGGDMEKETVRTTISETTEVVMDAIGPKKALCELLTGGTLQRVYNTMRVPDWIQLLFKLEAKLPDAAWQTMLNLTCLGRSGRTTDTPVLLTKNEIKALKNLVFSIVRKMFEIQKLPSIDFNASGVNLKSILVWSVRENQLMSLSCSQNLEFNIKIDGRPLGGKNQVAIGVVPITFSFKSSESALSVYPVAIGNCKESRENFRQLIQSLNKEKEHIKTQGLIVDGKKYQIKFTVTLDYKALLLLLEKEDDQAFMLGGKGYNVEFCAFCDAIRACTSHGADPEETCLDCLRSKAKIGRPTGIRDDLICLLEEDLSHINLCSLHCEMRNTEQLIGSLGLFSYSVGSLSLLNDALGEFGPEVSKDFTRVKVKNKPGQQTSINKQNVKVASFTGGTERQILKNMESIVKSSLPIENVSKYIQESAGSGKQVILDYVTFFEERRQYAKNILDNGSFVRDFGTHQETIDLKKAKDLQLFLKDLVQKWTLKHDEVAAKYVELTNQAQNAEGYTKQPKKKKGRKQKTEVQDAPIYSDFAAELEVQFFVKVCTEWADIALTMRDKVFDDKEDQLIDIHDIKCKEWGFLLKKLFGVHLGTGDYGHLTIDHSAMLLRQFRSMYKYSGQGFESSHKLHRQLFAKATNHDASGPGQSLDQILTHWYATHMLSLRHLFRQAMDVLQTGKKKFTFRGCGWKTSEAISLSEDSREWIVQVDKLFCDMFGSDFLFYKFNKEKGTSVTDEIISSLTLYDHELWEREYIQQCSVDQAISSSTCTPVPPKKKIKLQQAVLSPALNTSNQSQPTKNPSTISTPVSSKKKIVSQPQGSNTTINHSQPSSVLSNSKTSIFKQSIVMSASCTRGELASLLPVLPPVKPFLLPTSVKAVNGTFNTTDPCTLTTRPSESVVSKAELVLQKECSPAVYIPGLGIFNEDGIADFRKFCDVAKTAKRVSEEADWLVQVGCTSSEQALIADALWQKSPNSPLLKRGKKMIDV